MFDFLLVYPAAFLLGLLLGLIVRVRTGRRQFVMAVVVGLIGGLIAVIISLGYVRTGAELAEVLNQLALPAAAFCFVFGVLGTYLGGAIRGFLKLLANFVIETARLK